MKDVVTPVPPEEVRNVIRKCLEEAALVNYNKISSEMKVEGKTILNQPTLNCFVNINTNICTIII